MNLLNELKKPISLLIVGMVAVLSAAFFKITSMFILLQAPLFVFGFIIELIAVYAFLAKRKF
jgi:hypothetical protein